MRFQFLENSQEKTLASDLAGTWESTPHHLQQSPLSKERCHSASARIETPEEVKRLSGAREESHLDLAAFLPLQT